MYDLRMPPYGWEDYELWLRFASLGKKVRFIGGEPLSFYRSHPQSMSAVIDDNSYNLIKIYLNIKYNIDLELFMTPELERMVPPKQGLPVQEVIPEPIAKQPENPGFLSSIFRAYRKSR
jgi:hypothetical protein